MRTSRSPGLARAVDAIDRVDDFLDRRARELVADHVEADRVIACPERAHRGDDALGRARVRERLPVAEAVEDRLAPRRRVRDPLAAVLAEHVPALVVQDLDALELRVDVQHLAELLLGIAPVLRLHRARGVDHEDDVLAVDRDSRDRLVVDLLATAALDFARLVDQRLARVGERLVQLLQRVLLLGACLVLALDRRQVAAQPREALLLLGQLLDARAQLALEHHGHAANVEDLFLVFHDLRVEVLLRLLELDRLAELVQHEQQDDRAEAAADAVEERHAESLGVAARAALHDGQSFAGLRKPPPVERARRQK